MAGYPHVSVPAGFDADGVPVGASLFAQPWDEGKLLGFAFALEREAGFRRPPRLRGQVPPPPPPFDGCAPGSGAGAAPTLRPRPPSGPERPARPLTNAGVEPARGVWRGPVALGDPAAPDAGRSGRPGESGAAGRARETQPRQKPSSGTRRAAG